MWLHVNSPPLSAAVKTACCGGCLKSDDRACCTKTTCCTCHVCTETLDCSTASEDCLSTATPHCVTLVTKSLISSYSYCLLWRRLGNVSHVIISMFHSVRKTTILTDGCCNQPLPCGVEPQTVCLSGEAEDDCTDPIALLLSNTVFLLPLGFAATVLRKCILL